MSVSGFVLRRSDERFASVSGLEARYTSFTRIALIGINIEEITRLKPADRVGPN